MNRANFLHLSLGGLVMLAGCVTPASIIAAEPSLIKTVPTGKPIDLSSMDWVAPRFSSYPLDRQNWNDLLEWARGPATQAQTSAMRDALGEIGAHADALAPSCYRDDRCALVVNAEEAAKSFESFQALQAAAVQAQPYVATYRRILETLDEVHKVQGEASSENDAKEMMRRFAKDQILRYAFDELPGQGDSASEEVYGLYVFALESDLRNLDDQNITFAHEQISRYGGWPAPPIITDEMHQHLWALVQHGDHRPDIQFLALRRMQDRFDANAMPRQYALLYDRVMLKLTGQQRYGTQVTCKDGSRVALPLDDTAPIDELRSSVGLQPLDEYLKAFPSCAPSS